MRVAIIYGAAPTKDRNGLSHIAALAKAGHEVIELEHDQVLLQPCDIYIGHSFGGDRCLELIRNWPLFPVQLLVLIDPVKKGWMWPWNWFWLPMVHFVIPGNVRRAICFKIKNGFLPPSSSIRNTKPAFYNRIIEASHGDAPRNQDVVDYLVANL
jgi:pimeloyl-ACP methyl ester carboxylesterase